MWIIIPLATAVLALLLGCVLVFPRWFVRRARLTPELDNINDPIKAEELRLKAEADSLKAENDVRATLLPGIGGLAILAGVALTWVQFRATLDSTQNQLKLTEARNRADQEVARQQLANTAKQLANAETQFKETQGQNRAQFEAAQKKYNQDLQLSQKQFQATVDRTQAELDLARDAQFTQRFTSAVAQLADERLDVRLGGIYALERLMRDSDRDQGPAIEVLTSFVRRRAQVKEDGAKNEILETTPPSILKEALIALGAGIPDLMTDIQAVLTVLARRTARAGDHIDLGGTDLRRANLRKANLKGASFFQADLKNADFSDAQLEGARFVGAHLDGAHLATANGLSQLSIDFASCSKYTRLPEYVSPTKCFERWKRINWNLLSPEQR